MLNNIGPFTGRECIFESCFWGTYFSRNLASMIIKIRKKMAIRTLELSLMHILK